jgi:hypothetical protein
VFGEVITCVANFNEVGGIYYAALLPIQGARLARIQGQSINKLDNRTVGIRTSNMHTFDIGTFRLLCIVLSTSYNLFQSGLSAAPKDLKDDCEVRLPSEGHSER